MTEQSVHCTAPVQCTVYTWVLRYTLPSSAGTSRTSLCRDLLCFRCNRSPSDLIKNAGQTAENCCDGLPLCGQVQPGHTVCTGEQQPSGYKDPDIFSGCRFNQCFLHSDPIPFFLSYCGINPYRYIFNGTSYREVPVLCGVKFEIQNFRTMSAFVTKLNKSVG